MMNLLARILSHGFAFAVVALIILVLMYRGELFEELELPGYLTIKEQAGSSTAESGSGTVDRSHEESTAPVAAPAVLSEPSVKEPDSGSTVTTSDENQSGDDIPGAVADTTSEPETSAGADLDTANASAEVSEPVVNDNTEPVTATQPAESSDELSVDEASTTQTADDSIAPSDGAPEETPDGDTGIVEDEVPALPVNPEVLVDTTREEEVPVALPDSASATAETPGNVPDTKSAAAPDSTEERAPVSAAVKTPDTAETSPTADDAVSETPYALLAKAREAYWLRDFETAEQQYQRLTQADPDNPDGYGEMGNMFFSQGKWDEAAAAYYEAAIRLLNEGLIVQARQMLEVIRGLNGSQADDLESKISAASTATP